MDITVDEIRRILITSSGAPEVEVPDADFGDTSFELLGYDSLALMESTAVITRDYGVQIPDETLYSAKTPRDLATAIKSTAQASQ